MTHTQGGLVLRGSFPLEDGVGDAVEGERVLLLDGEQRAVPSVPGVGSFKPQHQSIQATKEPQHQQINRLTSGGFLFQTQRMRDQGDVIA